MKGIEAHVTGAEDLAWLTEVQEARLPLSDQNPIQVRHGVLKSGPPMTTPQRHPFCELSMLRGGRGIQYVEGEEAEIEAGDIFLAGPDVPHLHRITEYPHRFATVYFLPTVFIGPGPNSDGMRVLRRVTAHQPLSRRLVRPSPALRSKFEQCIQQMIKESESRTFGSQLQLQALLFQIFVELLRWEEQQGGGTQELSATLDWKPLDAALRHIQAHFDEPIYAESLAKAAGLGTADLKTLFRDALRMTWVQYLQAYRVRRAALFLSDGAHNVTEAALASGFESLSHFNSTFRRIMGVSPRHFIRPGGGER